MKEDDIRKKLLESIRAKLKNISSTEDELFYNRRWIFARLQLDERREKDILKKLLFSKKPCYCWKCREEIKTIKGIVLHRKNSDKGYSKNNSVFVCRDCHQQIHYKKGGLGYE